MKKRLSASRLPETMHEIDILVSRIAAAHRTAWLSQDDVLEATRDGIYLAMMKYDPTRGTKFFTYAWLVARHEIFRAIYRAKRQLPTEPLEYLNPRGEETEKEIGANSTYSDIVDNLLELLDPEERRLIQACVLEGYTMREVGYKNVGSVQWRIDLALAKLRKKIDGSSQPGPVESKKRMVDRLQDRKRGIHTRRP